MKLALALLLFACTPASAEVLRGEVVGVTDGDTITVLDAGKTPHKIRVQGIDTPERRQPYAERAKQAMSALVFRRTVEVRWDKRDRYGRIVGTVFVGGRDVGLAMVEQGLAWWYRTYANEQRKEDRARYEAAETLARRERRGLFADPSPTPPWEFRKRKR